MAKTSTKSNKRFKKFVRKGNKLATVATVKRLIGKQLEHKYIDYIQGATALYNTPYFWRLNSITQGLLDNGNRVGDTVQMKNITAKFILRYGNLAAPADYRIIFFEWYDNPGTTPAVTDLLQNTVTDDQILCSPYKWDSKQSYRILRDYRGTLIPPASYATRPEIFKSFKLSPKRKKCQFDAAGANSYNEIWVMAFSNVGVLANKMDMSLTSRIVYTDA